MTRRSRPDEDALLAIYRRLIDGEPDASIDLIELCLDPLTHALRHRYPSLSDPTWADDVAEDSLFQFVQSPGKYMPERGSLWSYLFHDAYRDLQNRVQKEVRRQRRLVALSSVELASSGGNSDVENEVLERLAPTSFAEHHDVHQILDRLQQEITDPRDWQVLQLIDEGERRTQVFAEVLGIAHLPVEEQRKQVKRVKDRLRVRLKRLRE